MTKTDKFHCPICGEKKLPQYRTCGSKECRAVWVEKYMSHKNEPIFGESVTILIKKNPPIYEHFGIRRGQKRKAIEFECRLAENFYLIPGIGKHGVIVRADEAEAVEHHGIVEYKPYYREIPVKRLASECEDFEQEREQWAKFAAFRLNCGGLGNYESD